MVSPAKHRAATDHIMATFQVYQRRACLSPGRVPVHGRRARARLDQIPTADIELTVVGAAKEIVIQLLATRTNADFDTEWARLQTAVQATDLPEPTALFKPLKAWKDQIRTFRSNPQASTGLQPQSARNSAEQEQWGCRPARSG